MPQRPRFVSAEVGEALARDEHALPLSPFARFSLPLEVEFPAANVPRDVQHNLGAVPDGVVIVSQTQPVVVADQHRWSTDLAFLQVARAPARAVVIFVLTREATLRTGGMSEILVTPPDGGGGGGTPDAHHASHEVGGTDVVDVTHLGGFPGSTALFLRADGSFAAPPTGGIPSAHHATHEPGGVDAITALDATVLTTGLIADARIPSTIQRKPIPATDLPAHATRHAAAGADPVTVTALAGYPGGTVNFLRADGTFAAPPTGGVPSAHHTTHEPGGSDPISALNGSVITSGTVADARLSANVQFKPIALADLPANVATKPVPIADGGTGVTTGLTALNASNLTSGAVPDARLSGNVAFRNAINTFALQNDFNGLVRALAQLLARDAIYLNSSGTPVFGMSAESAGTDLKNWQEVVDPANGKLYLRSINDAGTVVQSTVLTLSRNGDVQCANNVGAIYAFLSSGLFERGRGVPMGEWAAWTPSFSSSSGTWTVDSGDLLTARYTLVGKTCHIAIDIDNSSLSAASVLLYVTLPAGLSAASQRRNSFQGSDAGVYVTGVCYVMPGATSINVGKGDFSNWTVNTNSLHIHFSLTFEIS